MLKCLIFDLDGTLTELKLPLESMRQDCKNYYISKGLPPELLEPADGISSSTAKAREFFFSQGIGVDEWDIMQEELDMLMAKHEDDSAKDVTLMPGALETIDTLRSLGFITAILTNNGRQAMEIILDRFPLDEHFSLIHTRHESPLPKPYPDGLLHILSRLGMDSSEAVYVGDALIDAVAAERAGIEFWGLATGEIKTEELRAAGASHVFSELPEIIKAVEVIMH
jgi:HAD superfamily hydrolase (TIGR01549 family)